MVIYIYMVRYSPVFAHKTEHWKVVKINCFQSFIYDIGDGLEQPGHLCCRAESGKPTSIYAVPLLYIVYILQIPTHF